MLETSKKLFSMIGFPFLVDLGDGTPPSLNYMSKYFEDKGYLLCGGDVYEGSTFRMYLHDSNSTLETTRAALSRAIEENPNPELFLSYPCQGREWGLGAADQAGAEKVLFDKMMSKIPVNRIMVYSGGEICPASKVDDNYANRFQGLTFTLVVFNN
jgi:small ligand-binding sensory domain FIST